MMLGYLAMTETDCIFARRPFYVILTMRDQFDNPVSYLDKEAYIPIIVTSLTDGLYYDNTKCIPYSMNGASDIIQCQFEPVSIGDDQIFQLSSIIN